MNKLELLARISKLSALVHSTDLAQYQLSSAAIDEIRSTLDSISEEYVAIYC